MYILAIDADLQTVIVALLAMVCVGFTTWALVAHKALGAGDVDRRLRGLIGSAGERPSRKNTDDLVQDAAAGMLVTKLAALSKPLQKKDQYDRNQLAVQLSQAGIRSPSAVTVFLGVKMLLLALGAMLGLAYAWSADMEAVDLFAVVTLATVAAFYLPTLWLRIAADRRAERILLALPDSLDMLVIAVEAGLGLDAAIQRVGDEMQRTYPDLAEEWTISARETQMGIPRAEAMRKMAERTNVSDMLSLVAIVAQAERLGTSIAHTLRVHAETMRVKRRQRAEERAAKTTVKLLFPLVFFLFPTIFVVILGPAVINILKSGIFG